MSFITASIDYSKITPEMLKSGKYLNFVLEAKQQPDNFGNTHSLVLSQTKEERAAKAPKVYLGSAKEYKKDK